MGLTKTFFFYGGFCLLGECVVVICVNLDNVDQILLPKPLKEIILTKTGSEMTLEHPSDDELTITGAIYSE